jgi:MATE family multidrug resistance protein
MIPSYQNHLKRTIALAYPVTIGQLGHVMLGVVDSLMVGKVGATPLAASSLVNGLVFLVMVFGLGMSLAITPLVAIAKGREDHRECGVILRQALLINTLLALLLTLLVYFLSDLIFHLNQAPEVAQQAASYAKIIGLSILPFMIFQSYRQFIEGLFHTKPAMVITIIANFINAFGNWIFIYGNLGFQAYGLDGAGYATLGTRIFMALSLMVYVTASRRFKEFNPSSGFRLLNWSVIKKILNIGIPTGFQHFFEIGAFAFSAVMIGWLGSKPLAAHQIALNMASITFMIILGISAAGTIRVGNALGRKNIPEVRQAAFTAILLAAGIMACFAATFILLRNFLPTLYISDPEVISIAASLLIIAAFFQVSDGVQAVGLGVLRGITDVKIPMLISLIAYWIIGFPVGYYLGFVRNLGTLGVWIGLSLGLTIAAIFFTLRFHLKTKKMEQQIANSVV